LAEVAQAQQPWKAVIEDVTESTDTLASASKLETQLEPKLVPLEQPIADEVCQ